jgi:hypothetical protein
MNASLPTLSPAQLAESKGPAIIIVMCTFTSLATLFVIARILVRATILKKMFYDDYLIIVSIVRY